MRDIKLTINPVIQGDLEAELRIKTPVVVKLDYGAALLNGRRIHGLYEKKNGQPIVTIHLAVDWYSGTALHIVKRELLVTVLHEFRHAHQFDNWPQDKWKEHIIEPDAEKWAQQNTAKWTRLIQIRPVTRSSLSRLSTKEALVR